MTSIPVRKGTNLNRRSAANGDGTGLKFDKTHGHHTDKKQRPSQENKDNKENPRLITQSKDSKQPPFTLQSSKKDLLEENSRLHGQISTHEVRLKQLESNLLTTKGDLDRVHTESAQTKHKCETTLLTCHIDPVSLERLSPSEDDEMVLKQARDRTQSKVMVLKERLVQMNSKTSTCVKQLKEMCLELDGLGQELTIPEQTIPEEINQKTAG